VSLQGATSKRDSMWHSPVFTCIRPNRIPVHRIKNNSSQELRNRDLFTFSMIPSSTAFNKVYCGKRYRYTNICRLQETNFADLRNFMIRT
jgi:hypothetical protein